jgi:hypothetical protein
LRPIRPKAWPGRVRREIEPQLYRFPAIDPADLRRRVEDFLG